MRNWKLRAAFTIVAFLATVYSFVGIFASADLGAKEPEVMAWAIATLVLAVSTLWAGIAAIMLWWRSREAKAEGRDA